MNDWMKDALKEENLVVLNAQRDDYLRNLENAAASANVVCNLKGLI